MQCHRRNNRTKYKLFHWSNMMRSNFNLFRIIVLFYAVEKFLHLFYYCNVFEFDNSRVCETIIKGTRLKRAFSISRLIQMNILYGLRENINWIQLLENVVMTTNLSYISMLC